MSFRQGARQFFERRGAPTPPLPYDAEVDYLESTGTQYIDTGVSARRNLLASCMFRFVDVGYSSYVTHSCSVFGAYRGRARFGIGMSHPIGELVGPYIGFACCGSYTSTHAYGGKEISADTDKWHVATLDSTEGSGAGRFVFDGLSYSVTSASSFDTYSIPIIIFGEGNDSSVTGISKCRVSSMSIVDVSSGETLRDFIPVRFTNELGQTEGAMYDRVSGQLFRNSGTGAFLYGNDKS